MSQEKFSAKAQTTAGGLAAGTKVLTSTGIMTVEALADASVALFTARGQTVAATSIPSAAETLYEIQLASGLVLNASGAQHWPVVDAQGGIALTVTTALKSGDALAFTPPQLSWTGRKPARAEDAFLLGWLIGRPQKMQVAPAESLAGSTVTLLFEKAHELQVVDALSAALRATPGTLTREDTADQIRITFPLEGIMNALYEKGYPGKNVFPNDVWSYSSTAIERFLDGLFSAKAAVENGKLLIDSESRELLYGVAELLSFLGVRASIFSSKLVLPSGLRENLYRLEIKRADGVLFRQRVALANANKQAALAGTTVPNTVKTGLVRVMDVVKTARQDTVWRLAVQSDDPTVVMAGALTSGT
jgi:hypothetical protein